MQIDFLTIFPNLIAPYFKESILKRAQWKKLVEFRVHNLRDWTTDSHHKVDAHPYGGGAGMLFMLPPFFKALKQLLPKKLAARKKTRVIMLSPTGKTFTQKDALRLSKYDQLIFLCGRYEGFDARIENLVDEKISVGDYVLSGGELPALTVTEAVVRLIPGVLGNVESLAEESFNEDSGFGKYGIQGLRFQDNGSRNYKEYPHYTRPEIFTGIWKGKKVRWAVPKILLSGNHKKIAEWRKKQSS